MINTAPLTPATRFRCGGRCLVRADDLINARPNPSPLGAPSWLADGPCPKCGAHAGAFGNLGPAGTRNTYARVGLNVVRTPGKRCALACLNATSADCKCSCGGERHGIVDR